MGVAQLVERQVVILVRAGSSPVTHITCVRKGHTKRDVAQLDRALVCGTRGRRFDSCRFGWEAVLRVSESTSPIAHLRGLSPKPTDRLEACPQILALPVTA